MTKLCFIDVGMFSLVRILRVALSYIRLIFSAAYDQWNFPIDSFHSVIQPTKTSMNYIIICELNLFYTICYSFKHIGRLILLVNQIVE